MEVYENMRYSGVKWIGKVPSHWKITRMRNILENVSIKNHPDEMVLSLYREYGIVPKDSRSDNHNVTSEDTSSYKFVSKGNLVINKMKAWQGSLAVSDFEGIVSPAYYVCKFINNLVEKKYLHYLLRSNIYAQEFERLSGGLRIGQWDLGIDDFMSVPALIPPLAEQTAIAKYLDKVCAQIDDIVEETKKSAEDYKKLRLSVISEAVTGGLDKNAEMKDSGVEWIGKVPKGWKIVLLKQISIKIGDGLHGTPAFDDLGEYYFINGNNLGLLNISIKSNTKKLNFTEAQKYLIEFSDTTLLVSLNGTIGNVSLYANEKIILGKSAGYIILKKEIFKNFIRYYLMSKSAEICFDAERTGTTIYNLSLETLRNLKIPLPPLPEQKAIAEYLDKKCAAIDEIIAEKENLITDLELYKKSLIYETVTGKRKAV